MEQTIVVGSFLIMEQTIVVDSILIMEQTIVVDSILIMEQPIVAIITADSVSYIKIEHDPLTRTPK